MKFFAIFALVGAAVAAPLFDDLPYEPCIGLEGSAQCCSPNILNTAVLDCDTRKFEFLLH